MSKKIEERIGGLRQELAAVVSKEEDENAQVEELQDELKRRQESYVRRQRRYEERIQNLEDELEELKAARTGWMNEDEDWREISDLHGRVIQSVISVRQSTEEVFKGQEQDLLRAFRVRLFEIQKELELEKSKANDGASNWITKNRELERGLDWAREMADKMERRNQNLQQENARLKSQFKAQEDDREFLIKQLVLVKKDNTLLRQELESKQSGPKDKGEEIAAATKLLNLQRSPTLRNINSGQTASTSALETVSSNEGKFKEAIRRLKKLLETERNNLQRVRNAYAADLKTRTELEILLRQFVDDVRQKLRRTLNGNFEAKDFGDDLTRETLLQQFLEQEKVAALLYHKTFPVSQ